MSKRQRMCLLITDQEMRNDEDIAHFFRGFTIESDLKVVRDYFFQIQKTLKAYANNCVALEEDMFGSKNQILKVVPYGNAIDKIFKLYETSPEYKDKKHVPKERNLRFSDLVPNMSNFSEIVEETALQLAMHKADLILSLASDVKAAMLKIDSDERYRYGLDTGGKVLAYIDASCIIANVYTGFLCPLELQDNPDDIYNTLPIISMFTESAKMVNAERYEELLDLLDAKYHTNLCKTCGAHNNKSPFKIKTNNYVANPPHEAWGVDEIHVNISNGNCSKCQEKGVIKDFWNVKKTQTFKLQKLENMWIDNINPTAVTSEVISTHNGRSLKVAKTEHEKNFRIKIESPEKILGIKTQSEKNLRIKTELKPRLQPLRQNFIKLETTTSPLPQSSERPFVEAMESDSEDKNENENENENKNEIGPRRLVKVPNIDVSPGASDSTGLGLSSPVQVGSTKVYNIKNISDHMKEIEESPKKVSIGEVKRENLRKIYGVKKILPPKT